MQLENAAKAIIERKEWLAGMKHEHAKSTTEVSAKAAKLQSELSKAESNWQKTLREAEQLLSEDLDAAKYRREDPIESLELNAKAENSSTVLPTNTLRVEQLSPLLRGDRSSNSNRRMRPRKVYLQVHFYRTDSMA